MIGDQPEGTMQINVNQYLNIPGHGNGVITINYHLQSGMRNGVHFHGTSRVAYLPDNK